MDAIFKDYIEKPEERDVLLRRLAAWVEFKQFVEQDRSAELQRQLDASTEKMCDEN